VYYVHFEYYSTALVRHASRLAITYTFTVTATICTYIYVCVCVRVRTRRVTYDDECVCVCVHYPREIRWVNIKRTGWKSSFRWSETIRHVFRKRIEWCTSADEEVEEEAFTGPENTCEKPAPCPIHVVCACVWYAQLNPFSFLFRRLTAAKGRRARCDW